MSTFLSWEELEEKSWVSGHYSGNMSTVPDAVAPGQKAQTL